MFDADYRTTHNKTFHKVMLKENKIIPHKVPNSLGNLFDAAKKAHLIKSDSVSFSKNEDHTWITCTGEISHLVESLKGASELVDAVKSDTFPAVETFLTNADELQDNGYEKIPIKSEKCSALC